MIGCQKKNNNTLSPESMIKEVQKNLASANNMAADMTMEFSMTSDSDTFDIIMKADITAFKDPYKAKIHMNIDMGALGTQEIETYLLNEDNNYNIYMNTDGNWTKQALDSKTFNTEQNNYLDQLSLDLFLKNANYFKNSGTEKISGVSSVKLEGIIKGNTITELFINNPVLENFNLPVDTSLFDNLSDIPVTMWIDEKTMLPIKMSMDMTSLMQNLTDSILSSTSESGEVTDSNTGDMNAITSLDIPKCIVTIEYKSIGSADNFTVPDDIKNIK
jgi:hypothetical protein